MNEVFVPIEALQPMLAIAEVYIACVVAFVVLLLVDVV